LCTPCRRAVDGAIDEERRELPIELDMCRFPAKATFVFLAITASPTTYGIERGHVVVASMTTTSVVPTIRRFQDERIVAPHLEVVDQPLIALTIHVRNRRVGIVP
jgi:hypothetical protein